MPSIARRLTGATFSSSTPESPALAPPVCRATTPLNHALAQNGMFGGTWRSVTIPVPNQAQTCIPSGTNPSAARALRRPLARMDPHGYDSAWPTINNPGMQTRQLLTSGAGPYSVRSVSFYVRAVIHHG
jgi:hypothetical protein